MAAVQNFTFYNPIRFVFGKGSIAEISTQKLIPDGARVMLVYGGGSIKSNGVYNQCKAALGDKLIAEFAGIEPNPTHETCMKAVEVAKKNNITFILSVGGGSVIDATKYIVCAMNWTASSDPYDILIHWGYGFPNEKPYEPHAAIPFGTVLTIPAAGSEGNNGSVVSHVGRKLKKPFAHDSCFPQFSVLDPEVTYTLPPRQVANGIVDAYVHTLEQYLGHTNMARTQDRQAEALLCAIREVAPILIKDKTNYSAHADFMWCATQALSGLNGSGVSHCWAAHMIGHEMTALYGLDHGQTLALTVPAVMKHQKELRKAKYEQYVSRVFGYTGPDAADMAIKLTEDFFKSVGINTRLSQYGMTGVHFDEIASRLPGPLGSEKNIKSPEVKVILNTLL